MTNHLVDQVSPYLLQHANNPVNWYPWGEEALEKARVEDKPIFLSIGYAACHWCHVMAHESFENQAIADLLNDNFISIKVDREERPDLDGIYMNAVVSMTGQGGWPMSVFLTPEGKPFYAGTYFPPESRYGLPSFRELLLGIIQLWKDKRDDIGQFSEKVTLQIAQSQVLQSPQAKKISTDTLQAATLNLLDSYDWDNGGWGRAPKFPAPMSIEFLLLQALRGNSDALSTALHALKAMSRGGLYDLVGGGFHRYSTDDHWLVPHFEKMLYDNAQLAKVYLHAYLISHDPVFRRICEETLDFVARELRNSAGGFYSSLDADSESEEGKYYLWTLAEIKQALPPEEADFFFTANNITADKNDEKIILQLADTPEVLANKLGIDLNHLTSRLQICHQYLRQKRDSRVRPGADEKILTSWNALTILAFSQAARYLDRSDYLEIAQKTGHFLIDQLYSDGMLLRAWRNGQKGHLAFLEDYGAFIISLIDLYHSDQDPIWLRVASQLANEMVANYSDPAGGFFDVSKISDHLIARPKETQDNATPSGNSLATFALLLLSSIDEKGSWRSMAEDILASVTDVALRYPSGFSFWLQTMDFAIGPVSQVAIIFPNEPQVEYLKTVWDHYRPWTILASTTYPPPIETILLLQDKKVIDHKPTIYVCQNFVCHQPVTTLSELEALLS
jgi:uncharacterized protein YyaL (SSP411 family)